MATLIKKLRRRSGGAMRRAAHNLENRFLAAQGRKAMRQKISRAREVTRKAVRAGIIAGTAVAVGVVSREIRKRRRED